MGLPRFNRLPVFTALFAGLVYSGGSAARDGVCLYEDRNFSGKHVCVDFDVPALSSMKLNDEVSSVKLIGDVRVRFYEHGDYRGRSVLIERDVERLGQKLNDQFSSLRIFPGEGIRDYLDWDDGVAARHGPKFVDEPKGGRESSQHRSRPSREAPRVCLYDHWDYQGREWCFADDHGDFTVLGLDNRVSSLRLSGGAHAILFEHTNFSGYSRYFTQDTPRFQHRDNDAFSAILVRGR